MKKGHARRSKMLFARKSGFMVPKHAQYYTTVHIHAQ